MSRKLLCFMGTFVGSAVLLAGCPVVPDTDQTTNVVFRSSALQAADVDYSIDDQSFSVRVAPGQEVAVPLSNCANRIVISRAVFEATPEFEFQVIEFTGLSMERVANYLCGDKVIVALDEQQASIRSEAGLEP